MFFNSHTKQVSRKAFFHLGIIVKIRNILAQSKVEKLLHGSVTYVYRKKKQDKQNKTVADGVWRARG